MSNRAVAFFVPNQLGVGVRGGCEALVHSVREVLDLYPNKMLLQVDLINAFNKAGVKLFGETVPPNTIPNQNQ